MGEDVPETIRYFGEPEKIFRVCFGDVDRPLPHLAETVVVMVSARASHRHLKVGSMPDCRRRRSGLSKDLSVAFDK